MKLSWSHKLFLRINKQVGAHPWRDKIMLFCGHYLIYALALLIFLWATTDLFTRDPYLLEQWLKLLMTTSAFGLGVSWLIAVLFPHPRPIKEFPTIVQLVTPLGTWKSFPSDHTLVSFILAGVSVSMGMPLWFATMLGLMAAAVAVGRVYIGVHYPRDILGGMLVAIMSVVLSRWLLAVVTQPLYDLFITLF